MPLVEEQRPTTKGAEFLNIVLLGSGGDGHSGGNLADAIVLASLNPTDKKVNIISIPRDLWFNGKKINADSSIKDALSAITGLSIPYFVSIDFNNFIKAVDLIGGIDVDVKEKYVDSFYPVKGLENELCGKTNEEIVELHLKYSGFELEKQFKCRYEQIVFEAGKNKMDGQTALKYVRSRHGDSDFGRSKRQYEVLKAIISKAKVQDVDKFAKIIKTNIKTEDVEKIIKTVGSSPLEYSFAYIPLNDQNVLVSSKSNQGAYILLPKQGENRFEGIKKYIQDNI